MSFCNIVFVLLAYDLGDTIALFLCVATCNGYWAWRVYFVDGRTLLFQLLRIEINLFYKSSNVLCKFLLCYGDVKYYYGTGGGGGGCLVEWWYGLESTGFVRNNYGAGAGIVCFLLLLQSTVV